MSHIGFAEEATTQPFFKLTIRPGKAVMLTKVLRPGTHDKSFDIAVGGLKIPADACAYKKSKVRDKGGNISVDLSIEKSEQSAECYIDRGGGALPREACGSPAGTRCGLGVSSDACYAARRS
jgi:hypothetical protein